MNININRKISLIFVFIISTSLYSSVWSQPDTEVLQMESRQLIKKFASTLKTELVSAIKQGGPTNGIKVCKDKAQIISDDIASKAGVVIGRTSLKIRNVKNTPSDWQAEVLNQFEQQKNSGVSLKKLEYASIQTVNNGQQEFRYMKAIPVADKCLICHGEKIAKDTQQSLNQFYPQDKAVNFKEGDIRGAFYVIKALPQ